MRLAPVPVMMFFRPTFDWTFGMKCPVVSVFVEFVHGRTETNKESSLTLARKRHTVMIYRAQKRVVHQRFILDCRIYMRFFCIFLI